MTSKVSVIGPGKMGTGIAHVFLEHGYDVVLVGRSSDSLDSGLKRLSDSIDKAIAKGSLQKESKEPMLKKLTTTTEYDSIKGSELVIEAVSESYDDKVLVLKQAELHSGKAILATNTSSILISKLGANLENPGLFIGMHFFNPVPVMRPIELIITKYTSKETKAKALSIASSIGKTAIEVMDYPGFVANSVLMPMLNEAALLLQNGVASKEGIDQIVKLGLNHPMGPLELSDFIGIDVCVDIMNSIYSDTHDPKFKPVDLLLQMVKEGRLGKKSGEGFYKYR